MSRTLLRYKDRLINLGLVCTVRWVPEGDNGLKRDGKPTPPRCCIGFLGGEEVDYEGQEALDVWCAFRPYIDRGLGVDPVPVPPVPPPPPPPPPPPARRIG